jgi:hypothetical protein
MSQTILRICHFLGNISLVFEGDYGKDNPEIREMRDEILFKPLEGIAKDKQNLRNDFKSISEDLKKSFEEYKKEKDVVSY